MSAEQQLHALLQKSIADFSLSIVILTAGLSALVLWCVRSKFNERMLLWFALFATAYGARQALRDPLVGLTFEISSAIRNWVGSWLDFLIVIPIALLLEEIFGRGWRSSQRWAVWILAAYACFGIVAGIATGQPYYFPEPAKTILLPLAILVVLLNVIKGYRPPQFADIRIFLMGFAIFIALVLDDHLLPYRYHAEPLGALALICSMGAVAVRRTIRNERKLLAVEQELAAARQIQSSILPSGVPKLAGLTISAQYLPMNSVAGDFYDFALLDSRQVGILVADVAGHGIPAALIASMVKIAFASQQGHLANPGCVLEGLNRVFCDQLRGQYVTAGYLLIDSRNGSAVYSGAGHPPLIVWRDRGRMIERYENNGLFLGFKAGETYPNVDLQLSAGDRVLLYTDGLLEAANEGGESFADRLDERIGAHRELPASSFANALLADVQKWTARSGDGGQEDDLTLLVIDFKSPVSTISPS